LKKLISVFAVFAVLLASFSLKAYSVDLSQISAKYAVLVDATTGSVIYGKNEHQKASMASTTKIMTALILCEQADLNKEITVTEAMVRVEGSSMGLLEGDRAHYKDLLYGLLLASGNDAANAIALSIGGSFENFADMMNERAKQIGMSNTNFVTPSGLDDENHYTTAYDMALLACEAMKNKDFADACSSKYAQLEYGNPPYKRTLRNHNKLLKLYDKFIGIKTGFTKKSGRCLVSCAEENGKKVIAVTLNAPDDWNDHIKLLDFGIQSLETRIVEYKSVLPDLKVVGSDSNLSVEVDKVELSMLPCDFDKITYNVCLPDVVFAPIKSGDVVGNVMTFVNGKEVAKLNCTAIDDINSNNNKLKRDFEFWFKRMFSA